MTLRDEFIKTLQINSPTDLIMKDNNSDYIVWLENKIKSDNTSHNKAMDEICPTCLGSGDVAPANEGGITLDALCLACGGSGKLHHS
jgi:DnaJ-class molecular chaperone